MKRGCVSRPGSTPGGPLGPGMGVIGLGFEEGGRPSCACAPKAPQAQPISTTKHPICSPESNSLKSLYAVSCAPQNISFCRDTIPVQHTQCCQSMAYNRNWTVLYGELYGNLSIARLYSLCEELYGRTVVLPLCAVEGHAAFQNLRKPSSLHIEFLSK